VVFCVQGICCQASCIFLVGAMLLVSGWRGLCYVAVEWVVCSKIKLIIVQTIGLPELTPGLLW